MDEWLTPKDVAAILKLSVCAARDLMRDAGGLLVRRRLRLQRSALDAHLAKLAQEQSWKSPSAARSAETLRGAASAKSEAIRQNAPRPGKSPAAERLERIAAAARKARRLQGLKH